MSTTGASDLLLAPEVTFDVERFDWASDDRLEVVGRWSGVRGLRFVRPVLTVSVAGRRRRLVALLEHKPWSASDGEEWVAAFPWEGHREAVGPAQLAVGPSLVVDLHAPGPRTAPPAHAPSPAELALRRAEQAEARAAREAEAAQVLLRREREERRELEAHVEALRDDVAAARAVADDLRLELAGARARLGDALAAAGRAEDDLRARLGDLAAAADHAEDLAAAAERAQDAAADELRAQRERALDLERRLAAAETPPEPPAAADPLPAAAGEPPAPRPGEGREGRRTVKILDGPQRMPEVKPLLVQAAPLPRSKIAVWGRRIAAVVLLLAVLIALVIILR
jgi:signal transduction histidine kinase